MVVNWIAFLVIGVAAGWLAGKLMKGSGFGLLGNLVIGLLGALIGGALARMLKLAPGGMIGEIIVATLGAVLLLFVLGKLKKS